MRQALIFGYGSLVNRATHDNAAHPAELAGWRRVWRHTVFRPAAFLSVEPAPGIKIDGLVLQVPGNLAALDAREKAYARHSVTQNVTRPEELAGEIQVYAVAPRHLLQGGTHPIPLSYLDAVVQGFWREFGPDGARRFFATTAGWETPVLDDRNDPTYPRHQTLTQAERALVDDLLAEFGAVRR
jgi:hypothetical protein